jgi:hypothetical protein
VGYSKKVITLEALRKDYDDKAVYGLFRVCCLLPVILADKVVVQESLLEKGAGQSSEVLNGEFTRRPCKECCPNLMRKEHLNVEA